jgi:TPR repeat protein
MTPFAQQSCATGDSLGCALGDACQLTTPSSRPAALERLRAACEADQPLACLYWGDAQEGDPTHDDGRIRRAYGMACERRESPGAWLACTRAEAYELAHATSHLEADSAISHLRDQCLATSAPACCILADEYQSGKWVPADPERTTELRERACKLGEQRCCARGAQ